MTIKSKLSTAIATGAVLLNALAPAAFADTITVSGNGAFSDSNVSVNNSATTVVNQTNVANVTNNVSADADTGNNDANFNTGGDVTVNTGNASTNVSVNNALNKNVASVSPCGGCVGGSTNVTISGNGAFSDNNANVNNNSSVTVAQTNVANVYNDIDADADTGDNDANFNTGGNTSVRTGDASTNVTVSNLLNKNVALVGGGSGAGNGATVLIDGNGAFSDNGVNLNNSSAVVLAQTNVADVNNDVDADADTGNNDANFNTGGEVSVDTGDAKANVGVLNALNFNMANVDCECVLGDLSVKVANNGAFSDNFVNVNDLSALIVAATNVADLDNDVDADADTGDNEAEFNGAESNEDPSVTTGDANSTTNVSNTGNVNHYGSELGLSGLHFNFDLSGLLSLLHWVA